MRLIALLMTVMVAACGRSEDRPAGDAYLFDGPAPGPDAAAPAEPLAIPDSAPTVVFLGDSIGAGLHLSEHLAFPSVLQARLAQAGLPFHLISACESGRTTAGGVTALEWVMPRNPALVVIELGGNDGLRGVALESIEKNLRTMIERAKAGGAKVLLLGVRLPPNLGEYGAEFDALYPALAKEYAIAFEPSFMRDVGAVPAMNLADGLHPTAEGHERLADNVEVALRVALEGVARR